MTIAHPFTNDYSRSAHPRILEDLASLGARAFDGYGCDGLTARASELILEACAAPGGAVHLVHGGTQVNALYVDFAVRPWQSVVCVESGHIATHEAGAVEHLGHRLVTLPADEGRMDAAVLEDYLRGWRDSQLREHMTEPGLVYISQPTELGTLYSLEQLEALSSVCRSFGVGLYVDGARMGYGLASEANDVSLAELSRLTDAFTIGGTKCGMLFGEALVIPDAAHAGSMRTLIKAHGALLAKGWLLGVQFLTMFRDGLYTSITRTANERAARLSRTFADAGFDMLIASPTNQIFPVLPVGLARELIEEFGVYEWEPVGDSRLCVRVVVSWATTDEDEAALIAWIASHALR